MAENCHKFGNKPIYFNAMFLVVRFRDLIKFTVQTVVCYFQQLQAGKRHILSEPSHSQ